jgi:D-sedoheptulose 7-phosphate isomerase
VADLELIERAAALWTRSLTEGGKILLFGNGGSAADSQHIAAELVGRYHKERKAFAAMALTVNTSNLTAIGNDYSFNEIFARQVEAHGRRGDVGVGLSTSGNSPNIVAALVKAKEMGLHTIAMTGRKGGKCAEVAELALRAPSDSTPRVQELHITIGHIICEIVETDLAKVR